MARGRRGKQNPSKPGRGNGLKKFLLPPGAASVTEPRNSMAASGNDGEAPPADAASLSPPVIHPGDGRPEGVCREPAMAAVEVQLETSEAVSDFSPVPALSRAAAPASPAEMPHTQQRAHRVPSPAASGVPDGALLIPGTGRLALEGPVSPPLSLEPMRSSGSPLSTEQRPLGVTGSPLLGLSCAPSEPGPVTEELVALGIESCEIPGPVMPCIMSSVAMPSTPSQGPVGAQLQVATSSVIPVVPSSASLPEVSIDPGGPYTVSAITSSTVYQRHMPWPLLGDPGQGLEPRRPLGSSLITPLEGATSPPGVRSGACSGSGGGGGPVYSSGGCSWPLINAAADGALAISAAGL